MERKRWRSPNTKHTETEKKYRKYMGKTETNSYRVCSRPAAFRIEARVGYKQVKISFQFKLLPMLLALFGCFSVLSTSLKLIFIYFSVLSSESTS
jgi:hypothetical protein